MSHSRPGLLRGAAGVMLLLVSVGLFTVAWWTFEQGKPGAPPFPDARPDYGIAAGARVYLPDDAGITGVRWNVYYRADGERTIQDITVDAYSDRRDAKSRVMVVELREGARLVPEDLAATAARADARSATRGDGNQYVIVMAGGDGTGVFSARVGGHMRIPALAVENSRSSFVSPDVGEADRCRLPAAPAAVDVDSLDAVDPGVDCAAQGLTGTVTMQVEGYQRSATRLDFSDPAPTSGGGTALRWETRKETDRPVYPEQLRARASYVDIGGEAGAQRSLFASGVIIGLASAVAPAGVQLLGDGLRAGALRLRSREVERDDRPSTDRSDPWEGVRSSCAVDPRDVPPP